MNSFSYLFTSLFIVLLVSCQDSVDINRPVVTDNKLFQAISSSYSTIDFSNNLSFTEAYNPYTFKNFFNGGGVAIGDLNNDGLDDIYFSGNLVDNKLYLNKGNLQFEDITNQAGVSCPDVWSSGVSFVDINGDNLMDIYVCKSGRPDSKGIRHNELFINQGNLTFKEQAKEYGLDFTGLSTHAAFFDFDKDGDLDCYLLNNSIRSVGAYDIAPDLRNNPDPISGNKFLENRNINNQITFIDISEKVGVYTSSIGFGLGVSIADLNNDSWPDMYVSNDFFEKDYVYLNQEGKSFKEVSDQALKEMSTGAMGADIADINNDGLMDIFVTEMLPETLTRYKSKAVFDSYDKAQLNFKQGYHRQYGRNTLNQALFIDDSGVPKYAEVGRIAGVEATEWSWGALMNDFNNDGLNDIFIANGIYKDLLDLDYINYYNPSTIRQLIKEKKDVISEMMSKIPSQKIANKLYLNQGNYDFLDASKKEGFNTPNFSNGSAYSDLDNDGDLDLVVNTIGETSKIYRNNTSDGNSISIKVKGNQLNTSAIGTKVAVFSQDKIFTKEVHPFRGFQSCVSSTLHFGLGDYSVDSVIIQWPLGQTLLVKDIKLSTSALTIHHPADSIQNSFHSDVNSLSQKPKTPKNTSRDFTIHPRPINYLISLINSSPTKSLLTEVNFKNIPSHEENIFSDFDRERLRLYHNSNNGPKLAIKDINGNGEDDILMTGAKSFAPLILNQKNGLFTQNALSTEAKVLKSEAVDILVEDLNKDNTIDVLFAHGGNENSKVSSALNDLLISLDKRGNPINISNKTELNKELFYGPNASSSCVCALDVNNDGFKDVFIGSDNEALTHGVPRASQLFIYSKGTYTPSSSKMDLGMVTDCAVADINGDGTPDLVTSSEMGNIHYFLSQNNEISTTAQSINLSGFWSSIEISDIDNDGDGDILVTNIGENNRFKSFMKQGFSLHMFTNDFDNNRAIESIFCVQKDGAYYPIHLKDDISMQLPIIKKKFLRYDEYANSTMSKIFPSEILDRSISYEVNELRSGVFINENNSFKFVPFPREAQLSWLKAILAEDVNNDGFSDLIMGGNVYGFKPELGIQAGSYGTVLLNNGKGEFESIQSKDSGFFVDGEIRDIKTIMIGGIKHIVVGVNNNKLKFFKINE